MSLSQKNRKEHAWGQKPRAIARGFCHRTRNAGNLSGDMKTEPSEVFKPPHSLVNDEEQNAKTRFRVCDEELTKKATALTVAFLQILFLVVYPA